MTNPNAHVTPESGVGGTDMLYSGEQFDPNLQMQYLRARYYDQNNGTFNRADDYMGSNSDPQSLHKYAYCHGNPVMMIDPSGKFSQLEVLATVGAISTLAGVFSGIVAKATGGSFWIGFASGFLGTLVTISLLVAIANGVPIPVPIAFALGGMVGQIITEWGDGTLNTKAGFSRILIATAISGVLGWGFGAAAKEGLLTVGMGISKSLANLSSKTYIELSKLAFKLFLSDILSNYQSFLALNIPILFVNMVTALMVSSKRIAEKKNKKDLERLKKLDLELELGVKQ